MKMHVCDICKMQHLKLTESTRYWHFKSPVGATLRLDVCAEHADVPKKQGWKYKDAETFLMTGINVKAE